ncbi:MAG: MSHA biogenesis protein MshL [Candidatus Azotimanducaceae bacterium]|jgi:MSHA biogenesis protein MshL
MDGFKLIKRAPVLFVLGLSGCASSQLSQDDFRADVLALQTEIEQSGEEQPVVPVSQVETPIVEAIVVPRFDVSVEETPIKMFLTGLVLDSPFNIVVHPDVVGEVTLTLSSVTVVDVLEVLRDVYHLHLEVKGNLIRVMPDVLQTEVFSMDYVSLLREGSSDMRVSAGSIKDVGTQGSSQNNGESTSTDQQSTEVVGSRVTTESSVDMWHDLRAAIESLTAGGDGRQVIVMEQAGVIVVKALRSELVAVKHFLRASESSLQRQVVLEAKILEVVLSERFERGIDWQALDTIGGAKGGNVAIGIGSGGVANPDGINGVFTAAITLQDFTGIISLLESQGEVKVLSSPRIATVNNQKAVIKVGTDEFFVTNVTSTTTTGTSTTTTPSVTLTPFFSGIALDVTPQISRDGDVILHIHPTVSQVSDQNKVVTIGDDIVTLPLALSTIRESDSIVRAKNRQVIVIGGLMQNTSRRLKAGLPGISRLPLVGKGFSQERDEVERSELVILVRPVVSGLGEEQVDTLDSLRRIQAMEMPGD